jgi:hypothetical protein
MGMGIEFCGFARVLVDICALVDGLYFTDIYTIHGGLFVQLCTIPNQTA